MLKRIWTGATAAGLLVATATLRADQLPSADRIGDAYEITISSETATRTSDGTSNGSTEDRDALIERVLAVRADGLELEYDLPEDATAQNRDIEWHFPARIFRPDRGPAQLLNSAEMQVRADAWLKRAKLPKTACGHWYFTWNAFQVECDPQSVLKTLGRIDLRSSDVRDGASYSDPRASSPARLTKGSDREQGASFVAELQVDPAVVRHESAETDVVVAEVSGKSLTLDEALRAHAADAISGTMTVRFDTDTAGRVQRRTTVTKLEYTKPSGAVETQTATETIQRRLIRTAPPALPPAGSGPGASTRPR